MSSLVAILAATGAALTFFPSLTLGTRARSPILVVLGSAAAFTPMVVGSEARVVRFLLGLFAAILLMKMWDLHLAALRGDRPSFRGFIAFLANPFLLVYRKHGLEPQPTNARNVADLVLGALGGLAASAALLLTMQVDWSRWPFLVEHTLKATAFFLLGLAFFQSGAAAIRLLGGYAVRPADHPLEARTPADFWRRYNRVVGQFLFEDVFKPLHGRRHPLSTTLVVFAVSGLLHEYLLTAAIGRVQGLQMLFFVVQGAAVALTLRHDSGRGAALVGRLGTLAFNAISSVLFFASCNAVLRIYQRDLPNWLRGF